MTKYLIIGNSAAGIFAAQAVRQRDKEGEITILSTEKERAYSPCLTTYYVSGQIEKEGMYIVPPDFYTKNNIDFRGGDPVIALDSFTKEVTLGSGQRLSYDKLLIASGASAVRGNIEGAAEGDILVMRTMADAEALLSQVKAGKNRVAVLGGGLVSLKTAGALAENNAQVTVVVTSQNILSQQFDKTGADLIMNRLAANGVKFILGASAEKVIYRDSEEKYLRLTNGEEIPADVIFMGKGVTPNNQFLPTDIELAGKGIKVDSHMATNLRDIYAAGDVAVTFDRLTSQEAVYAIWPSATEQGEVAGANMAGDAITYQGAVSMNSLHFFGLKAICGGDSRGKTPEAVSQCQLCSDASIYRKCVFHQGRLIGFILVGKVENAGVLMANLGNELTFDQCMALLDNSLPDLN